MFEEIREIICKQLNIDESFVYPDTNLVKSLDVDSLKLKEIISEIEEKYQIKVDEESFENFKTVDGIIKYLNNE